MCIICVELENEKLTLEEARRNYGEIFEEIDEKHRYELEKKLFPQSIYEEYIEYLSETIIGTVGSD